MGPGHRTRAHTFNSIVFGLVMVGLTFSDFGSLVAELQPLPPNTISHNGRFIARARLGAERPSPPPVGTPPKRRQVLEVFASRLRERPLWTINLPDETLSFLAI